MSYCDRPSAERAVLQQYDNLVLVLRLQGFLFFAAANRLFDEIRRAVEEELDYLIIDFRDVLGVDITAMPALEQIERLAQERNIKLILSSVRPAIESRIRSLEAHRFGSLDAALEWRETQILKANPTEVHTVLPLVGFLAEELENEQAAMILRYLQNYVAPPSTDVIRATTRSREMFFLESGTIEALLNVDDNCVRASRIWPGTLFGEIGFHCGGPRTATLRTLEDCRLVRIERSAVARLEADFPHLAMVLHRFLARCAAARLTFYNDMVVDFFRSTLR